MKKRRILAVAVAGGLLAGAGLGFGACGEGKGDDYVGTVSSQTFQSAESAAVGFLAEEVSGEQFTATYVGYSKESELSKGAQKKLALGEYSANLQTAEKGIVEYVESDSSDTVKRAVYILTYADGSVRYESPLPEIGESLTASYYARFFDLEKYKNLTYLAHFQYYSGEFSRNGSLPTPYNLLLPHFSVCPEYRYDTNNGSFIFQFSDHEFFVANSLSRGKGVLDCADWSVYIDFDTGKEAAKGSNGWTVKSLDDPASRREELWDAAMKEALPLHPDGGAYFGGLSGKRRGVDHSDFIKTENGFELDPAKTEKGQEYTVETSGEYIVRARYDFSLSKTDYGYAIYQLSDFGKTKIEVPPRLKEVL